MSTVIYVISHILNFTDVNLRNCGGNLTSHTAFKIDCLCALLSYISIYRYTINVAKRLSLCPWPELLFSQIR